MSTSPFNQAPVAPFRNPSILSKYFVPANFTIATLSLGRSTVVTVDENPWEQTENFSIGSEVRFLIPPQFGCRQLNEQTGFIYDIADDGTLYIDLDSSVDVDPFIASPTYFTSSAQLSPVGTIRTGAKNITWNQQSNYPPGSYRNVSP